MINQRTLQAVRRSAFAYTLLADDADDMRRMARVFLNVRELSSEHIEEWWAVKLYRRANELVNGTAQPLRNVQRRWLQDMMKGRV
jgi:hypothetical protein